VHCHIFSGADNKLDPEPRLSERAEDEVAVNHVYLSEQKMLLGDHVYLSEPKMRLLGDHVCQSEPKMRLLGDHIYLSEPKMR